MGFVNGSCASRAEAMSGMKGKKKGSSFMLCEWTVYGVYAGRRRVKGWKEGGKRRGKWAFIPAMH